MLTTFRKPFGRFCWRRLPFGLNVSPDIFQASMDQILEGLKGVTGIGDDVCVYGENSEVHDRNLTKLMERAQEEGLVFSSAKCLINQRSISFCGNTCTDNGITADDDKVRDIQNIPKPENREDLHRFIGMMSYLSQFIPHFAEKAHTLRVLLKKDVPWMWDVDHQKSVDELKHAVSSSACLEYYGPTATVQLEVDASMKGLGIALVQKWRPVAFGSKTLTECESRYSNIEREMLAIVHGIQRYHTYLYGQPFKVITDQEPLVAICAKALHAAPPRLQRMLLKIQGYNFEIEYRPGDKMILADHSVVCLTQSTMTTLIWTCESTAWRWRLKILSSWRLHSSTFPLLNSSYWRMKPCAIPSSTHWRKSFTTDGQITWRSSQLTWEHTGHAATS